MFKEIIEYGKDNMFARGYHEKPPGDRFSVMSLFWPVRMYEEMEYLIAADKALMAGKSQSPPDDSLIVLCPMSFTAFTQIPIHVLADLKGRGCQIISITPGYIKSDRISNDIDVNVSNSIYPHFYTDRTSLKKNLTPKTWKVNLGKRICEYRDQLLLHTPQYDGHCFQRIRYRLEEPDL
ncbi:hypothetical protein LP421_16975 [Rhizobium sp. RCAM05350]|nr:hypothetical protein LP421_16975 [Rhizobium sp. RCAM05350]